MMKTFEGHIECESACKHKVYVSNAGRNGDPVVTTVNDGIVDLEFSYIPTNSTYFTVKNKNQLYINVGTRKDGSYFLQWSDKACGWHIQIDALANTSRIYTNLTAWWALKEPTDTETRIDIKHDRASMFYVRKPMSSADSPTSSRRG